ncbi:MAG: TIGR04282 family arsenosugar biosynthesis glycosyltransferase [Vicinamibacterales bacterium]
MSRTLIVLARAPSAAGKSRLTAGLPVPVALALRAALLLDTLDVARAVGERVTLAYTPERAASEFHALVAASNLERAGGPDAGWRPALVPQRGADLGARMRQAFADALAAGTRHAVLIGSDLPDLPIAAVQGAFEALARGTDVVLGPTVDGGYYLIGLTAAHATLFDDIPWSTADVLTRTIERARAAGLTTALVTPWYDVDRPEDARTLLAATDTGTARRTRAALRAAGMEE